MTFHLRLNDILLFAAVYVFAVLMNYKLRKCTFSHVCPVNTQISLHVCTVLSESSLAAFWIAEDVKFLHRDLEDSDQTAHLSESMFSHVAVHTLMYIPTCNMLAALYDRVSLQLATKHNVYIGKSLNTFDGIKFKCK